MDYRKYSAEDFALDEKFQKWVLDPDAELNGFWQEWLRRNPGQNAVIKDAIHLVEAAGLSKDHRMNAAYISGWKEISNNASRTTVLNPGSTWRYARMAAVLAFLIVSSFLLWRVFIGDEMIEYRTGYGEIQEYVLQDGSKVTLNSNSQLSLAPDWNDKEAREVRLEGEAFFDIVRTADKKGFKVSTKEDVIISVLGTQFNVNTRHEEVKVYLQSGKVRVNSSIGEATMEPGDFVLYKSGNSALAVNRNMTEDTQVLSWREQVFIFNDTPLNDVVRELEDNYGFKVIMKDKRLSEKRITAKVARKDVKVLLNVLSEALNIQIEQDGKQLTLK